MPSAFTFIMAVLVNGSSAFIFTSHPQSLRCLNRIGSSNNDEIFFDDFGDDFFDGSSSSNSNSGNVNLLGLKSRMGQVKGAEAAYDNKIARNWRRGNWSVRGFALDKSSYAASSTPKSATDVTDEPVHVSIVAAPTSSLYSDISLPQDKALPHDRTVAVGRTDGSVFIVKLGEQYLTNFMAVPKLVVEHEENIGQTMEGGDQAGMTVRVENEWMDSNEMQNRLQVQDEQPTIPGSPVGEEGDDQMVQKEDTPFEIAHQFLASEQGDPINGLVFHDDVEGGGIICTAAGSSGEISMWKLPSSDDSQAEVIQTSMLSGVHNGQIVSLKTMVLPSQNEDMVEQNVLFSASRDGTFALWDLDRNGDLLLSCHCTEVENDSTVLLTCADVSNPSSSDDSENDNDAIFLCTSNGYVMGYVVQELLSLATGGNVHVESECPVPNIRFRAHGTDSGKGDAVTAIKCGGDGTIPTSARLRSGEERQASNNNGRSPRVSSSILLTGGEDGTIKQWEILSQKTPSSSTSIRMEHWPRLSTQRMKRRSHIFSPSHDGPVTCISQQSGLDSSKFLTSGQDGSVCVWSASSGKELFRMDGFSGISSLACLGRELLVTDGMKEHVCVHDFGIEEDAASNGYDLEW
eukprot:CAMPEP_0172314068 /NCGR_PEP_ID=MMETSP1058-20130122/21578_1 /TAXON_ID=83371 /ORGANISM="Detonula confervacea, Strain CCMP 353" /LENGTH=629 /DNA_ID=CAMNT_0013027827 /DNA_START=40 /DNA_END=1926 /DNA_ORIENTATION=+